MNKTQQKKVLIFQDEISALRDKFEDFKNEIEEAFEKKSEKWQESDEGQEMQSDMSNIEDCYNYLDNAADVLGNISAEVD